MQENILPRKSLQYQPQGKRDLGRLYRRWKDQFMQLQNGNCLPKTANGSAHVLLTLRYYPVIIYFRFTFSHSLKSTPLTCWLYWFGQRNSSLIPTVTFVIAKSPRALDNVPSKWNCFTLPSLQKNLSSFKIEDKKITKRLKYMHWRDGVSTIESKFKTNCWPK